MADASLQIKTCPKCGSAATDLFDVDAGMRLVLKTTVDVTNIPSKVCTTCYNELTNAVSKGAKLRIEQQAREKNRHMLWKNRVNLIKHARQLMDQKAYSEAAVAYEKYLRVLEISYDLKPGALNPGVFGKTERSKELTVIATTYWDLLRIYDTHPKYKDRMYLTAKKLAEFIPFSPIFPDVIKKAQDMTMSAKNPEVVREFLRLSKSAKGRCFIATSAFANPHHPVVMDLQIFRDGILRKSTLGRHLIAIYYKCSPYLVQQIEKINWVKAPIRFFLFFLSRLLRLFC